MSAQIIGFDEACACKSPANPEVNVPPGDLHPLEEIPRLARTMRGLFADLPDHDPDKITGRAAP